MAARQAASRQCSRPSRVPAGRNPSAAFAFLFIPPRLTFSIDARYEISLGIFLVTAVVVGQLGARSRGNARKSARLSREQAVLRTPGYSGRPTLTQWDPTTATRWVIAIASHDQSEGTAYGARLGTNALAAYREADR